MTSSFLPSFKCFSLYYEYNRKYKLIISQFSDPFLCLISTVVAVTKLYASRPRKDPPPHPLPRGSKSTVQHSWLRYAAISELSSLARAPLFVLQGCTIFLWPWSIQFGDDSGSTCYEFVNLKDITHTFSTVALFVTCSMSNNSQEINVCDLIHPFLILIV
jgi:hypothetical protein